jgi:uncharacterized membrane protein
MSSPSDSTRLEAFSDAVFGFALTLLVVALEVPDSFEDLETVLGGFVAFAASFAVLYWIWYEHQRFFRRHPLADGRTILLNALLLFVVLFYVYPLKFMFTFLSVLFFRIGGERTAITLEQSRMLLIVYGLGFATVFAIFGLMYRHAAGLAGPLGLSTEILRQTRAIARVHALSMSVGLISVGLAWVLPLELVGIAGFFYALLGPLHALNGYLAGRRN